MRDISNELSQIMKDKHCSSLLAFMMVRENGFRVQQPKPDEESNGRLCDKRDSDTDR